MTFSTIYRKFYHGLNKCHQKHQTNRQTMLWSPIKSFSRIHQFMQISTLDKFIAYDLLKRKIKSLDIKINGNIFFLFVTRFILKLIPLIRSFSLNFILCGRAANYKFYDFLDGRLGNLPTFTTVRSFWNNRTRQICYGCGNCEKVSFALERIVLTFI